MKSALLEIKNAPVFELAANYIVTHADQYNITELILPEGDKPIYQKCAYIICNMPIGFIRDHAVELLAWFQDLNWPGVEEIYGALCKLPYSVLVSALKEGIKNAKDAQDEEWEYNLKDEFETYFNE